MESDPGTVLIAHPDSGVRRALVDALSSTFFVEVAPEPPRAQEILHVRAILAAVDGDGWDGLALLRDLRRWVPLVPRVLIGGQAADGVEIEAVASGLAAGVLRPPWSVRELRRLLSLPVPAPALQILEGHSSSTPGLPEAARRLGGSAGSTS